MDLAEEILTEYSSRFRRELEAKPLLMEIRNIFTESTAQEIERTIDREGNIIAVDKILRTLPMRTNWLMAFYNALNGREINKPELAELFKPFINTDKKSEEEKDEEEEEEEKDEEKDEEEEKEEKEEEKDEENINTKEKNVIYSLNTSVNDVPYFQVLKDFYPNDPPNWAYFLLKNGLQPHATLGDVLDTLFINNKTVYNQIRDIIKIKHAYIRQATLDTNVASLPSTNESKSLVTGSEEFSSKRLNLSSDPLNTVKPHLAPLREVMYDQEKAWRKLNNNLAQENETVFISDRCMDPFLDTADKNSTVSLPDLPRSDYKSSDLNYESLDDEFIKRKVPVVVESNDTVPETVNYEDQNTADKNSTVSLPDLPRSDYTSSDLNYESLDAEFMKRKVPVAVDSNDKVPGTVNYEDKDTADKNSTVSLPDLPRSDYTSSDLNYESLDDEFMKRKVPVVVDSNDKVVETVNYEDNVTKAATIKSEILETIADESKVPEANFIEKEFPVEDVNPREVPESRDNNNRLMISVDDIEISLTSLSESVKQRVATLDLHGKVPESDLNNDNDLETNSFNSEVSEFYISNRKVPGVLDNKMEVPQADIGESGTPEADLVKLEILESINNEMEPLEVDGTGECDNNINRASLLPKADLTSEAEVIKQEILESINNEMEPLEVDRNGECDNNINRVSVLPKADQEKSSMGLQLSILVLAMAVGFSFGYFCRAR